MKRSRVTDVNRTPSWLLGALALRASHLGSDALRSLPAVLSPSTEPWLVAAPYIGAPLGGRLAERRINFIDCQGNCNVLIAARFAARMQGRAPPKAPARTKEMRAPGYQVMFALLADVRQRNQERFASRPLDAPPHDDGEHRAAELVQPVARCRAALWHGNGGEYLPVRSIRDQHVPICRFARFEGETVRGVLCF